MATREYTMRFYNDTRFALKLRGDNQSVDAGWADRPPEEIPPRTMVA